ncbi:uncharacterized protein LOC113360342 [Papaver somniferum]|uniref:uncharacterized protein LOC113360342 n=1 Tax=Papaver somniferum TaxID=3469 RepID=UPI000E6FE0A4|nr:uncharacterized protein LOC113360342 [Papaver somniferum]
MDPKIICWNVRGLNGLNRRDVVKKKIRDWNPNIVLLQETKIQQWNDLLVWKCWSKKSLKWLDSPSQASSGDILCLWDSSKIQVLDYLLGPYSITILCKNVSNGFEWMFTGLYAPCSSHTDEVYLFWRQIEQVRCFWNYPWVLGGEFNEIRFSHERSSGGDVTNGMDRFDRFISKHHLIDLPLHGDTYTWTNNQIQSIRSRIDRFLISPDWECVYPQVIQQALARPCSDHNLLALICQGLKFGPPPFRCSAGYIFCKKLQLLKLKLREWSKREYVDVDRRLQDLEDVFVALDEAENANNGLS